MEGMHIVRDLLQRGNWMTRIDIKDQATAVFHDSNPSAASQISVVSVARKVLSVYMPPIWTGICPKSFHKDLEANRGFLKSRSVVYVDDLLLLHQDKENSQQQP